MKASSLSEEHERESRNERLNRALLEMRKSRNSSENKPREASEQTEEDIRNLPLAAKEKIFFEELERRASEEYWQTFRKSLLEQRQRIDAGFPKFCQLPKELRLQIWTHAMEDHAGSRVHVVTKKNGRFISNQTISILLRICSESRIAYLKSGVEAAFGTYVKFDTDVIYIRPFPNGMGLGPWYIAKDGSCHQDPQVFEDEAPIEAGIRRVRAAYREDDDPESSSDEEGIFWGTTRHAVYQAAAELTLEAFMDDESAKKIKRMAMTIDFFNNFPRSETAQDAHYQMRQKMSALKEILLVFDDMRRQSPAWKDTGAVFRENGPNERMHKSHKIGVVARRIQYMALPEYASDEFEPTKYRYVFIEEERPENQVPGSEEEIDALIKQLKESGLKDRSQSR